MEYKVVVSDPKTGKSYQVDVKEGEAKKIKGRKIGEIVEGSLLGMPGYKVKVTGGSDKSGFPMKTGLHTQASSYLLIGDGVGFKAERGERRRRRVHGEVVGDQIVQVNTRVVEYGAKALDEIFPPKPKEAQEEKK